MRIKRFMQTAPFKVVEMCKGIDAIYWAVVGYPYERGLRGQFN